MIIHLISRQEVIEGNTGRIKIAVDDSLREFRSSRNLIPIHFGIDGYDDDPRGLFDIPEIRSWCKQLYHEVPFLFSLLDSETMAWFFPCVADIEIIDRTTKEPDEWVKKLLSRLSPGERKGLTDYFSAATQIRYGPGTSNLVDEIWENGGKLIQSLASSQAEFDRLAEEIGARIRKGVSAGPA